VGTHTPSEQFIFWVAADSIVTCASVAEPHVAEKENMTVQSTARVSTEAIPTPPERSDRIIRLFESHGNDGSIPAVQSQNIE
jgi:hypothetical protein